MTVLDLGPLFIIEKSLWQRLGEITRNRGGVSCPSNHLSKNTPMKLICSDKARNYPHFLFSSSDSKYPDTRSSSNHFPPRNPRSFFSSHQHHQQSELNSNRPERTPNHLTVKRKAANRLTWIFLVGREISSLRVLKSRVSTKRPLNYIPLLQVNCLSPHTFVLTPPAAVVIVNCFCSILRRDNLSYFCEFPIH